MFYEFAHRHTPCIVDGLEDAVILSRDTRATTIIGKEYTYNGVFAPTSAVENGSSVEAAGTFFVQTLRLTTDQDKYCSLIKTNAVIEVQRYTRQFDANYNPSSTVFVPVEEDIKAFTQYITIQLRQDDPGLLPTTIYVLQLQTSVDVRRPQDLELQSPDRIILDGRPYQVDAVDRIKYPNLLHVQLSEDLR